MTQILKVYEDNLNPRHVAAACQCIQNKGIVLAPTETGYCFFGDAELSCINARFLRMRQAHQRDKPFSILCKDLSQVSIIGKSNTSIYRTASRVLPGPYTLILETTRDTPQYKNAPKRNTVGIRISSNAIAQALVTEFGKPLLITSVTDADELLAEEYYDANNIEDHWWTSVDEICLKFGEDVGVALESENPVLLAVSTVVDFTQDPPAILRDGGWNLQRLGLK